MLTLTSLFSRQISELIRLDDFISALDYFPELPPLALEFASFP